jgi:hypothetical protein
MEAEYLAASEATTDVVLRFQLRWTRWSSIVIIVASWLGQRSQGLTINPNTLNASFTLSETLLTKDM